MFKKSTIALLLGFYLIINLLFVYKYGVRLEQTPILVLIFGYIFSIISIFLLFQKIDLKKNLYKKLFFTLAILFFGYTLAVNFLVDGDDLNADRWSAMHVGIESILKGEYPYDKLSHLKNRTSNLPSLSLIGLPFYLLGDVGYLQCTTFILWVFTIFKLPIFYSTKTFVFILTILSPSYHWEIFAKSDLMSNFIIIACSLSLILIYEKNRNKLSPFWLGLISSFLLLTRLTAIVPLILFYGKRFLNWSYKSKLVFIFAGLATFVALLSLTFLNFTDYETLIKKNPFQLQNRQLPFLLSLGAILLPCLFIFKVKNIKSFIQYSFIFISVPVVLSFLIKWYQHNFEYLIFNINADISYFNIIINRNNLMSK